MITREEAVTLQWLTPPARQGRAVEISYAVDNQEGDVLRRTRDHSLPSSERDTYEVARGESVDGPWEPWQHGPSVPEDAWEPIWSPDRGETL